MGHLVILLALLLALPGMVQADLTDYGAARTEELLFLHTVIYDYRPDWQRTWEQNYLSQNGTRSTFGSISKSQLLHYEDIVINQDLGRGWWFRGRLAWEGTRHRDIDRSSRFIGFQKEIRRGMLLSAMADFRHDKSEIDAAFGVLFISEDREEYAWFDLMWEDIAFDERTRSSGRTTQRPLGLRWQIRQSTGRLTLITEGILSNGFSREYASDSEETTLTRHDQRLNTASATFIWQFDHDAQFEVGFDTYHFDELERYTNIADDDTYLNEIHHGMIRYLQPWGPFDRVWVELHGIRQFMRSRGVRADRFIRTELLPGVFVSRRFSDHTIDAGYLGSFFGWELDDRQDSSLGDTRDDFTDKLSLSWTYHFTDRAMFRAALSHVVDIERFGGGNGQFMLLF